MPPGLVESSKLPTPIFTPATKAPDGEHDENISFKRMGDLVGSGLAGRLKALSLRLFNEATHYAESRGFILADTKFEFGLIGGEII